MEGRCHHAAKAADVTLPEIVPDESGGLSGRLIIWKMRKSGTVYRLSGSHLASEGGVSWGMQVSV